jgi:hypothetical protein
MPAGFAKLCLVYPFHLFGGRSMRSILALAVVALLSAVFAPTSEAGLFGKHHRKGACAPACCEAAPVCCEAPAPAPCCEAPAPAPAPCCEAPAPAPAPCCEAPAPVCCEAAPSCGKARNHGCKLFSRLGKRGASNDCCPAPAPAPSCGCGH